VERKYIALLLVLTINTDDINLFYFASKKIDSNDS